MKWSTSSQAYNSRNSWTTQLRMLHKKLLLVWYLRREKVSLSPLRTSILASSWISNTNWWRQPTEARAVPDPWLARQRPRLTLNNNKNWLGKKMGFRNHSHVNKTIRCCPSWINSIWQAIMREGIGLVGLQTRTDLACKKTIEMLKLYFVNGNIY